MADVDEVIRAAVAAGELIIRAAELSYTLAQGARSMALSLAQRLASARGGGAEQVPVVDFASGRPLAAFTVPVSALGEVRQIAKREGVPFALALAEDRNCRVLVCLKEHKNLFYGLRHLGHEINETQVPPMDSPDADFCAQPRGSGFDTMEFSAQDAAWFCSAANEEGVRFTASDPRTTPGACQKDAEILMEEAEDLLKDDPAWETVRETFPRAAIFPAAAAKDFSAKLPADVLLAQAPRTADTVLAAFRAVDAKKVLDLVPQGREVSFVTAGELEQRFLSAHTRPLRVVTATEDRERVTEIMNIARRAPLSGPVRIAAIERACDSIETRVARAVRQMAIAAGGARDAVYSCTLFGPQAEKFRAAARSAAVPIAASDLGGELIRFDVPGSLAQQADALLRGAASP